MASVLGDRVVDARGRRVVFVSHCLLDENVRYLGGATCPGAVDAVLERCRRDGLGLCQMPCPEQHAWGGVDKPLMAGCYGSALLRRRWVRRPFVAVAGAWMTLVYRVLARRVARDVAAHVAAGCEVVEIVGVGASPSCGVRTTLDLERSVAAVAWCDPATIDARTVNREVVAANVVSGSGLFVRELAAALRRRRLDVPFTEHDLLGELRDTGALSSS